MKMSTGKNIATLLLLAGSMLGSAADASVHGMEVSQGDARGGGKNFLKLLRVLEVRAGGYLPIAFSPDGQTLATGGANRIYLWDPVTGGLKRQLAASETGIWFESLAFSPDGKTLASGQYARDGWAVILWNPNKGEIIGKIKVPEKHVHTLSFSPDGRILAGGASCGSVYLWDPVTGIARYRLEREMPNRNGRYSVAFSADGRLIAAGGVTVAIWDVRSGKRLRLLDEEAVHVAFWPDRNTLLGVGRVYLPQPPGRHLISHPAIFYWNLDTGKERRLVQQRLRGIFLSLAFSSDGRCFATAGPGWRVGLWETASCKERCFLQAPEANQFSLAFSPDGQVLATGYDDGLIRLWHIGDPDEKREMHHAQPSRASILAQWHDLASADATDAYRAMCTLVSWPAETVSVLKECSQQLPQADPKEIRRLVKELDSNSFAARKRATEDLEKLGVQAKDVLKSFLGGLPPLEARRRAEGLLDKIDFPTTSPDRLRAIRVVEILEKIGNTDARRLLKTLADGAPGADLAEKARAALARLSRRSPEGDEGGKGKDKGRR